jgi:hypothetical protein
MTAAAAERTACISDDRACAAATTAAMTAAVGLLGGASAAGFWLHYLGPKRDEGVEGRENAAEAIPDSGSGPTESCDASLLSEHWSGAESRQSWKEGQWKFYHSKIGSSELFDLIFFFCIIKVITVRYIARNH